jgi:ribosomal protein L40E
MPGPSRPVARQVVQAPVRVFYRSRCDHCGAPRRHGAEACRYCGSALVTRRKVSGVSEGLG